MSPIYNPPFIEAGALNSDEAQFEGGAKGDGVTDDTKALNAFLKGVGETGSSGWGNIKPGTYKISGEVFVETSNAIKLTGAAGNRTTIKGEDNTYNWFRVKAGNKTSVSDINTTSFKGSRPKSEKAAFVLDNTKFATLERIGVNRQDIGFNIINNCFGLEMRNCSANQNECNIGLNCSNTGSDCVFIDCWLYGELGGVSISSGNGDLHFFGGQINCGINQTEVQDLLGQVILGKDYLTGAVGTIGSNQFVGVDFEGAACAHIFRSFATNKTGIRDCSLQSGSGGELNEAISVFKSTGSNVVPLMFENNSISGTFSGPKLLDLSATAPTAVGEFGTSGTVTVNAETINAREIPMTVQSKIPQAYGFRSV